MCEPVCKNAGITSVTCLISNIFKAAVLYIFSTCHNIYLISLRFFRYSVFLLCTCMYTYSDSDSCEPTHITVISSCSYIKTMISPFKHYTVIFFFVHLNLKEGVCLTISIKVECDMTTLYSRVNWISPCFHASVLRIFSSV